MSGLENEGTGLVFLVFRGGEAASGLQERSNWACGEVETPGSKQKPVCFFSSGLHDERSTRKHAKVGNMPCQHSTHAPSHSNRLAFP